MNKVVEPKEMAMRLRSLRGIQERRGTAEGMGISYSALAKYETGAKVPNDSTKVQIANYYGVTVQQIFYDP